MTKNRYSPLTEASFLILLSLRESRHGYGIIKHVERLTRGRLVLAPGTLYGALTNLQKNKLINVERIEGAKRKKTYHITELGNTLVDYELNRLEELIAISKGLII